MKAGSFDKTLGVSTPKALSGVSESITPSPNWHHMLCRLSVGQATTRRNVP